MPQIRVGYAGGGVVAEAGEADDDAAAAIVIEDLAANTLEGATGDDDLGTRGETHGAALQGEEVLAVLAGGENEVEHLGLADTQGGVLVELVPLEVVVIVAKEGGQLGAGTLHVLAVVADDEVGKVGGEIGEEYAGNEVFKDALAVSVHLFHHIPLGHVSIVSGFDECVGSAVFALVGGPEHEPLLANLWSVLYRHPFARIFSFGDGNGGKSGVGHFHGFHQINVSRIHRLGASGHALQRQFLWRTQKVGDKITKNN